MQTAPRQTHRVVVIGAGVAGLVAALELAVAGLDVTVLERAEAPGGKLREAKIGAARVDAGPTVFTMRWVFEAIFAAAGARLADHLTLQPASILARHAWGAGQRLDLFADIDRSADAIGRFAGSAEAAGYRAFCARARHIYATLEAPFIQAARPSALSLVRNAGLRGLRDLSRISPFATLWQALGEHFRDPRLRQLFGRYATYCGASPFLAPATLMLVAHVEQDGVWLVEGGMHRIARALEALAARQGARFRYGAEVAEIRLARGRPDGVRLATGEVVEADAVILNADVAALATGLFGDAVAASVPAANPATRSLSAVTWAMVAQARGFPLLRHTVFFSDDYQAEFDAILRHGRLPEAPTVYVCAQDRGDTDAPPPPGAERLLCLINAPPTGDRHTFDATEMSQCEARTFLLLERSGLTLTRALSQTETTTPGGFHQRFPATGGALYGQATHGPMASFRRPGARSKIPQLYLCGGSTHPGPGVPMAALSGRLAASSLLTDLTSASRSRKTATPGGMSTR